MHLDPMALFWGPHSLLSINAAEGVGSSKQRVSPLFDAVYLSTRSRPEYVEEVLSMAPLAHENIVILASSQADVPTRFPPSHRVTLEVLNPDDDHGSLVRIPGNYPETAHGDWDLWRKRSVALQRARDARQQAILFLDDDVRNVTAATLVALRGALSVSPLAGCVFEQQADHSLIGHLIAATLAHPSFPPRQYLGGGMLAVSPTRCRGSFLNIYNEDWLFILANVSGAALSGGKVMQCERWLYFVPEILIGQEFGDILAESFRYLNSSNLHAGFSVEFWSAVLDARRSLLCDLVREIEGGVTRIELDMPSTISSLSLLMDYVASISPVDLLSAFQAVCSHYQIGA